MIAEILIAYIDPSAGGMLYQILAILFAFLSGVIFFFSRQIKSAIAWFKRTIRGFWDH